MSEAERIGDAERDAAARSLTEHLVAGRLNSDEFDARLDRSLEAKTVGELGQVFSDLPGGLPSVSVDALVPATEPGEVESTRRERAKLSQVKGIAIGSVWVIYFAASILLHFPLIWLLVPAVISTIIGNVGQDQKKQAD